ncbi:MAG TPA: FAD-binding oxidoreductase [Chloroflexota bacterium]|jgi:glycolate oxidase FAD binding subunit|nr:FAD-binding oxidoreductase [Chloroflexota bacterium]
MLAEPLANAAGAPFGCAVLRGDACSAYAVQGVLPQVVLLPESEQEAAAALAACNAAGLAVAPWGGGTLQGVGNVPSRLDAVLSLERLDRIIVYEPDDLTISVQAGVTLAALQRALAPHGQMLPFDVAAPERATIGGAVAVNLAGPRRFGAGSYRDLLIGLTVAAPDGTISKAGGLVVKNVSGYDMMKLHLGALGTLGLLLRLNFKLLTQPALDSTASISGGSGALLALAAALAGSQLVADSIELCGPGAPLAGDAGWRLAVRLTGSEQGMARKRREIAARCREAGLVVAWLEGPPMLAWWQHCNEFLSPAGMPADEALLRLAAPPAQLGVLLEQVHELAATSNIEARLAAHAGNGVLFARLQGPNLPAGLPGLFSALAARGRSATLLAALVDVKRQLDVWGALPDGFALMRQIKEQFDPRGTLNPGRFLGRL